MNKDMINFKVNKIREVIKEETYIIEQDTNLILDVNRLKEVAFIKSILELTNYTEIRIRVKEFLKDNTINILD